MGYKSFLIIISSYHLSHHYIIFYKKIIKIKIKSYIFEHYHYPWALLKSVPFIITSKLKNHSTIYLSFIRPIIIVTINGPLSNEYTNTWFTIILSSCPSWWKIKKIMIIIMLKPMIMMHFQYVGMWCYWYWFEIMNILFLKPWFNGWTKWS